MADAPSYVVSVFADGSFEVQMPDATAGDAKPERRSANDLSKRFLEALKQDGKEPAVLEPVKAAPEAKARPNYFQRMLGKGQNPPGAPKNAHIPWAIVGSFLGQFTLLVMNYPLFEETDLVWIVGSFGAQAVLLFAAQGSPLAQPWNCIFGNGVGSLMGVVWWKLIGDPEMLDMPYLSGALAVSTAIGLMLVTRSVHPPAGATALIATLGGARVKNLGFWYVLFPAVFGSTVHVIVALIFNNISADPARQYPVNWRPTPKPAPKPAEPTAEPTALKV